MAIALCQILQPSRPSLAQGRGTITANSAQISPDSSRILRRTGLRLSGHEFRRPSAASRKFRVPLGRPRYTAEWLDSKWVTSQNRESAEMMQYTKMTYQKNRWNRLRHLAPVCVTHEFTPHESLDCSSRLTDSRQARPYQCIRCNMCHRTALIPIMTRGYWRGRARVEVGVPLDTAWRLWEDREQIPRFMPWIASVKVGGLGGLGVSHVCSMIGPDWACCTSGLWVWCGRERSCDDQNEFSDSLVLGGWRMQCSQWCYLICKYHMSFIIRYISYIIYHVSYIIRHTSYILYHISYIIEVFFS